MSGARLNNGLGSGSMGLGVAKKNCLFTGAERDIRYHFSMVTFILFALALFLPVVVFLSFAARYRSSGYGPGLSLVMASRSTARFGAAGVLVACVAFGVWQSRVESAVWIGVVGGVLVFIAFRILARGLEFLSEKLAAPVDNLLSKTGPGSAFDEISSELGKVAETHDPSGLELYEETMNFKLLLFILFTLIFFVASGGRELLNVALVVRAIGCMIAAFVATKITWRVMPQKMKELTLVAMALWPVALVLLYFVVEGR